MSRIITNRVFDVGVALAWCGMLLLIPFWPASFWYELNRIDITDVYLTNGYRVMEVDRSIHRNFAGVWRVEEQLLQPSGKFSTVRRCTGSARYRTDKGLPDPLTQEWWRYGVSNCAWVRPDQRKLSGAYRDCTWVTIHTLLAGDKEVTRCSNTYLYEEKDT